MSLEHPSRASSSRSEQARPAPGGSAPAARSNTNHSNNSEINTGMPARILSACDACRQSKVKCTGGNPCLSCQWDQKTCNYSPGSRLGRPKGSKNKRTLLQQQSMNLANKDRTPEAQKEPSSSKSDSADVMQWIDSVQHHHQQHQGQPGLLPLAHPPAMDLTAFDFNLDHMFDTTIEFAEMESHGGDASRDLVLDLDLAADLMDMDALGNADAQTSRTLLSCNTAHSGAFRAFTPSATTSTADPFSTLFSTSCPTDPALTTFPSGSGGGGSPASPLSPPPSAISTTTGAAAPPAVPSNPPPGPSSNCTCLPRLVRLLYHLEGLRYTPSSGGSGELSRSGQGGAGLGGLRDDPSADSILRGVQAAKTPWKSLMHCSSSSSSSSSSSASSTSPRHGGQGQGAGEGENVIVVLDESHREAFLLFAMSIRILLSSVQRLNSAVMGGSGSPPPPLPTGMQSCPPHAHHHHHHHHSYHHHPGGDVAVSVGSFELTGEAKAEIIGVVIRRALWAIGIALQHLWERAGRPVVGGGVGDGNNGGGGGGDNVKGTASDGPMSPMAILTAAAAKEASAPSSSPVVAQQSHPQQRARAISTPTSPTAGRFEAVDECIVALLVTLQCTMKALEQEGQGVGGVPEQKPSPYSPL